MDFFSDFPIARGVIRFLEGGILYSAADYEPIKDWLVEVGLWNKVSNPTQSDAAFEQDIIRFFYNDNRAQVVYALVRALPDGVLDTATDEELTLIAQVLLMQRMYREDCCKTLEQVLEATQSFKYRLREEHELLLKAWRVELDSIDNLLDCWKDRLPILRDDTLPELFDELPQHCCVDDAVFLYKEGLSDWLLAHPDFERLVGAELEHLESVPGRLRAIVGRVVRLCQSMEDDGSERHKELMRAIDKRLSDNGITPTEGEMAFSARPIAYREAFKALRSGSRKLSEVDESLWDDLLVDVSLRTDWSQIKQLPKAWLTPLRCEHAVAWGDPYLFQYVPKECQTLDMVYLAVQTESELVRYANPDVMSLELAYEIVTAKGQLLRLVPQRLITEGVAKEALKQNIAAWLFIPEAKRTVSVCQVAVEVDPNFLSEIPESCRTAAVCLSAVAREPKMARYVPKAVWNDPAFRKEADRLGLSK